MIVCHFDKSEHKTIEDLHNHLKRYKIKRSDYYEEYYPKKDLLTGEKIPFKDYEQYFSTDFLNKNNLKKWFKLNPELAKKWAKEFLLKRKEKKGLICAPSQIELKTICSPSMDYFNSIGDYFKITEELGFKKRYNSDPLSFGFIQNPTIIYDTREQHPLIFPVPMKRETIKVGDYMLDSAHDIGVRIERKSLSDLAGTLTKGFDRFCREIDRAVEANQYVILVVEEDLQDAMSFNYLPHMKFTKAQPSHVFKLLRDILVKYPNHFQALFVNSRVDAVRAIMQIFKLGEQVKTVDLHHRYEKGEL